MALNSYVAGQCTWWAEHLASWWPNGAGNAKDWWPYAQAHGFATSQQPVKGAIAVWDGGIDPPLGFGHVGVVQDVHPDGSWVVSEMNFKGAGVVDTRNVGDRGHLLGFILPPGTQAPGTSQGGGLDLSPLTDSISGAGATLVGAGQVAGGALLVVGGLVLAALLVIRPDPLRR